MPYIDQEARHRLHRKGLLTLRQNIRTPGELNYVVTVLCHEFLRRHGGPAYADYNTVIGVLACAQAELYRRMIAPYEDKKIEENGDVP